VSFEHGVKLLGSTKQGNGGFLDQIRLHKKDGMEFPIASRMKKSKLSSFSPHPQLSWSKRKPSIAVPLRPLG